MKKNIIIYLALLLALPVLLQAQYLGGNGRGDVSVSLTNINISVKEITAEIQTKYDLAQNYPNPFNPTTNVRFSMCNVQFVTLKIFDMLGREVATLVNEELAPGSYSVDWNASQFSSGIYFYTLTAGDYKETKRMTLIK